MELSRLDELKSLLVEAESFQEPWDFFFDHFGQDPDFLSQGVTVKNAFLKKVLDRIVSQLFGRQKAQGPLMLRRLPKYQFIHGSCLLQGCLAVLIYFEDVDTGMLSLLQMGGDGEVKLVRFTGYTIDADQAASFVPPKNTRPH